MADPYRYFRVEAGEILEQLQRGLLELERGVPSTEIVPRLLRLAHTLKGAARVVKQSGMADLSHAIEDVLVPIRDGSALVVPAVIGGALKHVDVMRAQLQALSPKVAESGEGAAKVSNAALDEPFWAAKANAQDLDVLMDSIGELNTQLGNIRRSRRELEQVTTLVEVLAERVAPRGAGQSAGAVKLRALVEELQSALGSVDRELVSGVEQAGRELGEVRDAAERLRLVPADLMWGSLARTARDAALSLGKKVRFEALGGDVRLDAELLGLIQRALVQAVRNSVAHGIELPAARVEASKSAEGEIRIEVIRRDKFVEFSCRDDGRGLDLEAVRQSAERHGLAAHSLAGMNAEELAQLLLRGGISTARTVTAVSGRGIGLDLVRETAEKLGGSVTLRGSGGRGTTLTISVPVSLSALSALLVEARGQVLALPLNAVHSTLRQLAEEVARVAESDTVFVDGRFVPYVPLAVLLGSAEPDRARRENRSAVLVTTDAGLVAVGVDRLLGIETIVARSLPEMARLASVIAGASFDGDGNPRLLLSPEGLIRAAQRVVSAPRPPAAQRAPILVIDDSLTTRMLEQSILESAGYEVDLATSGEEGLLKARARKYALFLVDVEMPGMDGFTFVEQTRADPELKATPAILVTSRASPEDLQRGVAAGACAHIEKKSFDQMNLLERIRGLVG